MSKRGFVPLSPLSFLERSGDVYTENLAIITSAGVRETYGEMRDECRRIAASIREQLPGSGQVVAVLSRNGPELLKMHYGVPGGGAVLLALNTRLSSDEYRYMLEDADVKILFVDPGLKHKVEDAAKNCRCALIELPDPSSGEYWEDPNLTLLDWVSDARTERPLALPESESAAIALNYTSGTTGRPKGAVYTHRGAYLNALSNAIELGVRPESSYLWTLPMFHCNGWCYTWGVTAVGGTHVTVADFDASVAIDLIQRHAISHLCGAPVVASAIAEVGASLGQTVEHDVVVATGGSPPSPTTISNMRKVGIKVLHLYGLTETYGPSLVCEPQPEWNGLSEDEVASLMSRQGVRTIAVEAVRVVDDNFADVPPDGAAMGEIAIRSNTCVGEYLHEDATSLSTPDAEWFRTGDLAVVHEDGYIEIRDRKKDIIISGGENVSSIEVENVLASHPAVREAAVVALPDAKWGEVPVAYVELREGGEASEEDLIDFVRQRLAHFKAPKRVTLAPLPKTSTGKTQKHLLRREAASGDGVSMEGH